MRYATVEDIQTRMSKLLSEDELIVAESLLEDAALMIDSINSEAKPEAKKVVSCRMIARAIGFDETSMPIGASQATMSALGYSQTFTMGSGTAGELYISKAEKSLLGAGNRIGAKSPLEDL